MRSPSRHDDQRCLSAQTLAALRQGALSLPERAAIERHLESCPACRERVEGGARIIPFRPRGAPRPEPEAGPRRGPVAALILGGVLLFVTGTLAGRLVSDLRRPERVLEMLMDEISQPGLVLGPAAEDLLSWQGEPLRLTPQQPRLPPGSTGAEGENSKPPSELDRRWLELATLEAIEQREDPLLLQGLAYLTAARARTAQDLAVAREALLRAQAQDPTSPQVLSDLAVLEIAVRGEAGRADAWSLLARAVERAPHFAPALYNQAVLARGTLPAEDELRFVLEYLDVDGGHPWAARLRERQGELERRLSR